MKADITQYNFDARLMFSNLAVEFFNWDEFTPAFLSQLESMLGGKVESYAMHY